MNIFTEIWNSQFFAVALWCILTAAIFGPMVIEVWQQRSKFDVFEAKQVFRGIYFLYFGLPSLYYIIQPRQFPHIQHFDSTLRLAILAAIIGIVGFYLGGRINARNKISWPSFISNWTFSEPPWQTNRLFAIMAGYGLISAVSLFLLLKRVGGACYYFTHLGQTNVILVGNIYFVWGILLFKSATLLFAAYMFQTKRKLWYLWILLAALLLASGILLTFLGARILLIVYIIELMVLFHYLWRKLDIKALIIIGLILVVGVVGIMGEFRNFSWSAPDLCTAPVATKIEEVKNSPVAESTESAQPTPSPKPKVTVEEYTHEFTNQLSNVSTDKELLLSRYIDNYFDSVRTTMMVIENTPDKLPYQYGLGYAQIIVQPIPRAYRPSLSIGEADPIFTEGEGYSRITSFLGESYINFSISGLFVIPALIGLACQLMYSMIKNKKQNAWRVLVYGVFIGGLMMGIRGYFVGSASLFLMDLVPLLLAYAIMSWRTKK